MNRTTGLPYNVEGIEECRLSLEDVQAIIQGNYIDTSKPIDTSKDIKDTKDNIITIDSKDGIKEIIVPKTKPHESLTVSIYAKRIEEVIKQKLTSMEERCKLNQHGKLSDKPHVCSNNELIFD